jgi:Flp pilus assembly CpaF family ATPase
MSNTAIESSEIEVTPDYQAVIDAIERHDPYIFVSGKAGTGKTTLIGYLREIIPGNVVVVAQKVSTGAKQAVLLVK